MDADYTISYAGRNAHGPRRLTVTADDKTQGLRAALPTLTASYSGFVNGDTASLTTQPTVSTTATAASHVRATRTITPAGRWAPTTRSATWPGRSRYPGGPDRHGRRQDQGLRRGMPTLTVSYSGFVNGDTAASLTTQPTLTTTATAASRRAARTRSRPAVRWTATTRSATSAGPLTVTTVALTITANNQTKAYGAALPTLTVSYSGFVNGDTAASLTTQPTLTTTATAASPRLGQPVPITASGAVDSNYTISYVAGTLTVTPAALTVTADNKTKVYGAAMPTLTVSYSGFVNGDTSASLTTQPTLTTTATAASQSRAARTPSPPAARWTATTRSATSPASLTVTPAALTITADGQTKVYGAALPTLTASYSGFVNGDTSASLTTPPTLTTTATAASHVGQPLRDHRQRRGGRQLHDQLRHRTLTVTPAALTITADGKTKVYGAALPTLTVSYSGFVNGDTAASLTTLPTVDHDRDGCQPCGW